MNIFYTLLLVLIGFMLLPSTTFACGNDSENNSHLEFGVKKESDCCNSKNHSCKKESSKKSENQNCCCNSGSQKNSKKNHNCNGKCGNSKCGASYSFAGFPISLELSINNNFFDFSNERQKFFQSETFLSSGFYSIWLIPKINQI